MNGVGAAAVMAAAGVRAGLSVVADGTDVDGSAVCGARMVHADNVSTNSKAMVSFLIGTLFPVRCVFEIHSPYSGHCTKVL